jgi:hypothetical protein
MADKLPKQPKATRAKRNVPAASLANLKPIKPGEVRNPTGRSGWDGEGGFSLKTSFKNYMKNAPPGAIEGIWAGLIMQAHQGNTNAVKMLVELIGEQVNDNVSQIAIETLNAIILPNKVIKDNEE